MAYYLLKSRYAMQNLNPKLGFLYMFCQSSCSVPFTRHPTFQSRKHKIPVAFQEKRPTLFTSWRSESIEAPKELDPSQNFDDSQASISKFPVFCITGPLLGFNQCEGLENHQFKDYPFEAVVWNHPGGKIKFTSNLDFLPESHEERIYCYRLLDDNGQLTSGNFAQITKDVAVKMYSDMAVLQTMDTIFYEAQRQGRISFYVTTIGEEAINVASAAALQMDDLVFPQYREPGILLWRGFTLQEFANQCFGNKDDNGKGRQMPAHYGSNKHNYFTVASTVGTQISHAVGAAYSLKMDQTNACTITYFGDGGTSTGDFHAALNFAAVMGAPVIFFCRNNGWAISTPLTDQFRSDGIAARGQAYGIRSIRVDGNDALAIYSAVHAARQMAISEQRPILIEALTYRAGHHSTSDDSTKYRPADEIEWWKEERNPVTRFRKWLEREGWWSAEYETEIRSSLRKQVLHALQVAEKVEKPPVGDIFTDVYDAPPSNLREQERSLRQTIKRHPQDYPADVPI